MTGPTTEYAEESRLPPPPRFELPETDAVLRVPPAEVARGDRADRRDPFTEYLFGIQWKYARRFVFRREAALGPAVLGALYLVAIVRVAVQYNATTSGMLRDLYQGAAVAGNVTPFLYLLMVGAIGRPPRLTAAMMQDLQQAGWSRERAARLFRASSIIGLGSAYLVHNLLLLGFIAFVIVAPSAAHGDRDYAILAMYMFTPMLFLLAAIFRAAWLSRAVGRVWPGG